MKEWKKWNNREYEIFSFYSGEILNGEKGWLWRMFGLLDGILWRIWVWQMIIDIFMNDLDEIKDESWEYEY